jgi:hypothetical protein
MLNNINASTGFSGFQLMTGQSPRIIHELVPYVPNFDELNDIDRAKLQPTAHGIVSFWW